ncbi:PAS domain S-box protein, partial [Candidatus Bathyarchaeota archaeon]|nr:PAS domain S-box protein [Candidatus Bathyarchaeota archaeon]
MMRQGEGVIILLLEDDPAHAEAIRRALEASDLKAVVHVAGTLREYHEAIAVRLPDIVLMDMVLPDGRALDVLTSPPDACPFPILLMTSYGNEQTAVQAMKAGALDYIVKSPEAFASMPHAVERALREWNMFQQRKRAKAALRESEERFRTLYENSTLGLYRTTPDGRIVLANPALVKMLGYSSFDDLSGRDLKTDGFESSYPRAQFVEMVEKEDAVMGLESVWKRRDGTTIFVRESARAIRGPEGQIIYFDGTVEDVTSRKAAEEKLAYEQNLLRALLENATDQVYFKDKDSQFIRISQAQADRLGLSDPAQAEHKSDFDYFNEDHARQAFLDEQEVMRTGRPLVDLEEKETTLDGRVTWVSTTKVPLRDTQGQILGTFGMSRDVTERKQTEEALRESEERFRTLYENSTLGLYRTTTDGRIVLANPALVTMLGYSSFDDLSGMDLKADGFEPSYPRTQFIEMIEKEGAVRGLESAWKRRDGTTVFVRESARAIRDPEGRTVYFDGTVEDITGRKEAEEEVRRKNASLEAINDIFKETLACETSEEVG